MHLFSFTNYFIFTEYLLCLRYWLKYHNKYKNDFHRDTGLNDSPVLGRRMTYMSINYNIKQEAETASCQLPGRSPT